MNYPAVRQHRHYSLNLYEDLELIFEDIMGIDQKLLEQALKEKAEQIELIPKRLQINLKQNTISFYGHRLHSKKYFIPSNGVGDIHFITYKCPNTQIIAGLEYLCKMFENLS